MERRKEGRKDRRRERGQNRNRVCVRRVNDRKVGALGCYPPRGERERKRNGKRKTLEGCGEGGRMSEREREREGTRRKVSNGSALTSSLAPIPSLARLSFIVATEEDQYGPRGV